MLRMVQISKCVYLKVAQECGGGRGGQISRKQIGAIESTQRVYVREYLLHRFEQELGQINGGLVQVGLVTLVVVFSQTVRHRVKINIFFPCT